MFILLELIISQPLMNTQIRKKEQMQSTNHTGTSRPFTPKVDKEKYVTPFGVDTTSPLHRRMVNSPLHGPLAIALRKLVSQEGQRRQRDGQEELKLDLENIKNILQEFAESLCAQVEREIYAKFNIEMKRMVLKYRQAEKLLRRTQEKLTVNADILHLQQTMKQQKQRDQLRIKELQAKNQQLSQLLFKEARTINELTAENTKQTAQNFRLSTRLQRLQQAILRKLESQQQPHSSIKNRQSLPRTPKPLR